MKSARKLNRVFFSSLALLLVLVFSSSCATFSKEKSLYEKIITKLTEMESFEATAYVKYISNNKSNTYVTQQQVRSSGEYRIEVTSPEQVAGNVTIFDGKVISQYNKNLDGRVSVGTQESMERSEILLTSFVKNYLSSEEKTVSVSKVMDADETVIEASIPGDNKYMATEKLWVDNETLKPIELIIYDQDGSERIIVNYKEFEYNKELEDSLFVIQR